jgi:hypothetical protein
MKKHNETARFLFATESRHRQRQPEEITIPHHNTGELTPEKQRILLELLQRQQAGN